MEARKQTKLPIAVIFSTWLIASVAWVDGAAQEVDRKAPAYLYGRYGCVACHGPTGAGTAIGPAIVKRPQGPLTDEEIIRRVRTTLDMMPAYPPERLSDEDLQKIVSHVAILEAKASETRR